jgi:hypothetical protein
VQVTIQPENTTITFAVLTTNASGSLVPFTSGPYGSPVYYQAHVSGQSGYGVPGAYVNFYDSNGYGAGSVYLDKQGNALTPALTQIASGAHSITAAYYGDNSFNTSANLTPINLTITQIATTTSLTSQQTAQSLLLTTTVNASGLGTGPTGAVTFSSGGTVLGTAPLIAGTASNGTTQSTATFDASQLAAGQYNVTASYPGDTNYTASNSTAVALNLVADFSVANRGITSQTVVAGGTAQYINDIAVTPFFGFSSTVTLSCTVPANLTTCTVNPNSLTTSGGVNIASVAVTTKASGLVPPFGGPRVRFISWPQSLPVLLLATLSVLLLSLTRARRQRFAGALPLAGLLLFLMLHAIGCGGGSSTPPPPPPPGTAAGTYTVTVTATSGSLTHTTTLTLVVQ